MRTRRKRQVLLRKRLHLKTVLAATRMAGTGMAGIDLAASKMAAEARQIRIQMGMVINNTFVVTVIIVRNQVIKALTVGFELLMKSAKPEMVPEMGLVMLQEIRIMKSRLV